MGRRFGPDPLPADERRTHCVSVRLNARELQLLDERRARVGMQRGEYLRVAALKRIPRSIPEINRRAYSELARAAANLNQIARHLNAGDALSDALSLDEVRKALHQFRLALIKGEDDEQDQQ